MARTNSPAAAPSAAHTASAPNPAPDAITAPDSPAAAVQAALAANPGATAVVIADAAAIDKPAAREALIAMEKAGTATRVKGGRPGIPDTWTLADPAPPGADPAPDPEDEQDAQPGDSPGGTDEDEASGSGQDGSAEPSGPPSGDGDGTRAEVGTSAAPDPETQQPEPHDDAPAGDDHEDAVPREQDDKAMPDSGDPQDPDNGGVPREEDAVPADGDGDGEASGAPDPALVTEITERIGQIKAAADAAAIVLTAGGNLRAVLAGLDEVHEQAVQGRRALKAALGGRAAPAARPGGLRDKVMAHLDAHPEGEFTPHEIHKVLNHSSGAIANALDTLVKHGEAELATEKPRRFRRAASPSAPETPGTDDEDSAADSTELAGAA